MKQNPRTFKFGRVFRKKLTTNKYNCKTQVFLTRHKYGFKAVEIGKITYIHLKMIDLIFRRYIKDRNSYKINLGLTVPVSRKPVETRMGKGKGEREYWECSVTKGMFLLEVSYNNKETINYIFNLLKERLPFKIKLIKLIY